MLLKSSTMSLLNRRRGRSVGVSNHVWNYKNRNETDKQNCLEFVPFLESQIRRNTNPRKQSGSHCNSEQNVLFQSAEEHLKFLFELQWLPEFFGYMYSPTLVGCRGHYIIEQSPPNWLSKTQYKLKPTKNKNIRDIFQEVRQLAIPWASSSRQSRHYSAICDLVG